MFQMIVTLCVSLSSPGDIQCTHGLTPFKFKDPEACAIVAKEYTDRLSVNPEVLLGEARCEKFGDA